MKDEEQAKEQLVGELIELRQRLTEFEKSEAERKRVEEKLHRSLEETAHSQRLLLALSQAAQAVQRVRTPEEVNQTIGDEIAGLGYHATIFTLTDDQTHLTLSHLTLESALLRAAEKLTGLSARNYCFPLVPGGFYQRIIAGGKTVLSDPGAEPIIEALPGPVRPLAGRLAAVLGLEQAIYAPLTVGNQVQGLLTVLGSGLTEADVPAVTAFANQAAIAVENARLYQEAQQEIFERSRAEEALKNAELEKETILDSQLEHVVYQDKEHRVLWLNQAACESVGMTREGLIGRYCYEIWAERSERCEDCPVALAMKAGQQQELEKTTPDGRTWFIRGYPVRDARGKVVGGIEITQEITGRKRAEARAQRLLDQQIIVNRLALALGHLTDRDQIYRTFYEMVRALMDADGFIVSYYDREEQLTHTEYALTLGTVHDVADFPPILIKEEGKGLQSQVIRTGKPLYIPDFLEAKKQIETQYTIQPDGRVVKTLEGETPVTNSALLVPIKIGGETVGVMQVHSLRLDAYGQDDVDLLSSLANMAAIAIQNARLLEQSREQAQQVQQIVNTVPEGVLLLDNEQRVVLANPAAQEYLVALAEAGVGDTLTQLGDRPLAELLTSPPKGLWHDVATDGWSFQAIARSIEAGPTPGGWVLVIRDVTQEREIQRRVQQQERLAAVGQLAAGIAHDFNNIMATIVLYAQMSARTEGLPDRVRERMATINQQAQHATRLIRQILDFSRRTTLERRPLDLLLFLKEQVQLLKRTLPENIEIDLNYGSDEYTIDADLTSMQQVFMNLAVNARDAMSAGGELHFGLGRIRVEDPKDAPLPEMEAAVTAVSEWVQVTVSDTGTGIPPDVVPHIFDPFFTTKASGQGTGLGLAQAYGIVMAHEGHIGVESQEGEGTTFTIYLPAPAVHPSEASTGAWPEELPTLARGHGESILVVEDDAVARKVLVEGLELLNYRVLEAANGYEALEVLEQRGGVPATGPEHEIALVLSDVVMPGMGGIALLHALRERGLNVGVVLLTGHPLEKELQDLRAQRADSLLLDWLFKPTNLEQLADVVAQALNATRAHRRSV